MNKTTKTKLVQPRFGNIAQVDLPQGRNGKHKAIVQQLLSDLSVLPEGRAMKVPLSQLPDTKGNIRSAMSRATRKMGIEIVTSSDAEFLYIWKRAAFPKV